MLEPSCLLRSGLTGGSALFGSGRRTPNLPGTRGVHPCRRRTEASMRQGAGRMPSMRREPTIRSSGTPTTPLALPRFPQPTTGWFEVKRQPASLRTMDPSGARRTRLPMVDLSRHARAQLAGQPVGRRHGGRGATAGTLGRAMPSPGSMQASRARPDQVRSGARPWRAVRRARRRPRRLWGMSRGKPSSMAVASSSRRGEHARAPRRVRRQARRSSAGIPCAQRTAVDVAIRDAAVDEGECWRGREQASRRAPGRENHRHQALD
jgi:hypothetical protein